MEQIDACEWHALLPEQEGRVAKDLFPANPRDQAAGPEEWPGAGETEVESKTRGTQRRDRRSLSGLPRVAPQRHGRRFSLRVRTQV
jgi:hypothetical protein